MQSVVLSGHQSEPHVQMTEAIICNQRYSVAVSRSLAYRCVFQGQPPSAKQITRPDACTPVRARSAISTISRAGSSHSTI